MLDKDDVLGKALAALPSGLCWELHSAKEQLHMLSDGVLSLMSSGGHAMCFVLEIKGKIDRFDLLRRVAGSMSASPLQRKLLVAPYISDKAAEQCRSLGLNFIDSVGNAWIEAPGLYVRISGHRHPVQQPADKGHAALRSASTLKVIFALLCHPSLAHKPMRDIAKVAGVALGSTAKALDGLRRLGHLSPDDGAERRLIAVSELQLEWARLFPIVLRGKLNPQRYTALSDGWWKSAKLPAHEAAWGGEVAAHYLTHYLAPEQISLYCWAPRGTLIVEHRLRPDPQGSIEILDAFWPAPASGAEPLAPALLVYADLLASNDGRNQEVATILQERLSDADLAG